MSEIPTVEQYQEAVSQYIEQIALGIAYHKTIVMAFRKDHPLEAEMFEISISAATKEMMAEVFPDNAEALEKKVDDFLAVIRPD